MLTFKFLFLLIAFVSADDCPSGYRCLESNKCRASNAYLKICKKPNYVCCPIDNYGDKSPYSTLKKEKEHYNYPEKEHHNYPEKEHHNYPEKEHHSYPEKEHYSYPEKEHYSYPEKEHYSYPEKEHYSYPEKEHYSYPEKEHYSYPEKEHYSYPEKEHYSYPEKERYYPQTDGYGTSYEHQPRERYDYDHYDNEKDSYYNHDSYNDRSYSDQSYNYFHDSRYNYGHDNALYDNSFFGQYERLNYYDYYQKNYRGPRMSKEAHSFMNSYKYTGECGVQRPIHRGYEPRISTGHVVDSGITEYGDFPWNVAILHKANEKIRTRHALITGYKFHCGGTIIRPRLVLTAAHCVAGFRKLELKVKLGEWNLRGTRGEIFPTINRKVRRIIIHDNYDSTRFKYDIAILVLDRPVVFKKTPIISPACLPPNDLKLKQYSRCYIAGFGEDLFKPNYGSNLLKSASVNLQDDEDCKDLIHNSIGSLVSDFYHESHRCFTGGYGKDACVGDGGGAVVCPISNQELEVCKEGFGCNEDHYFIAGVVSWGSENCADEDSVTVITDMVPLRDWVDSIIRHTEGRKPHTAHGYPYQDTYDYSSDAYGHDRDEYSHRASYDYRERPYGDKYSRKFGYEGRS